LGNLHDLKLERAINAKRLWYRSDPIAFETEVLDVKPEHVWPKMREVAESVRDHQLTAVPAGHSVTKTYGAARIAVWFKTCFQPSTVITTAPSEKLIKDQLWREIHTCYSSSVVNLGGVMTSLKWDLKPSKQTLESLPRHMRGNWEKNFMMGFATSPDTATEHATKMQGWHNEWLLVILDEAGDLMSQIWKTVLEGLIINERCKVLAIGNPTNPYSKFADVCKMTDRWHVIRVSTHDTPNYIEDREVIPNLAGRQHERDIIAEYGEGSNEHRIRCLGLFPTYSEGAVYGERIGELEEAGYYGDYPWNRSLPVYIWGDYGNMYTAIGFFQFIRETIRMVDYFYDDRGMGVPGYCSMLDSKPYIYAKEQGMWLSHDYDPKSGSNKKSIGTGTTVLGEFSRLGYMMSICESYPFDAGVADVKTVLPLMRINSSLCSDFWDALKNYKFKKDLLHSTAKKAAYSKLPQEGPSKHPADMLRSMASCYRWELHILGERIGYPNAIPANAYYEREEGTNPNMYAYGGNPNNY
jgi:hypothetical protein